jgi:hypothetical protein
MTTIILTDMQRLPPFFLIVSLLVGACSTTSTDFQAWQGKNRVVQGQGGTKKVVDGIDIWTYGEPPQRFQILGIIQDERPGRRRSMADRNEEIVQKAREHGGDGVIMIASESQLTGYYNVGSANTQIYGGSATTFGSGVSIARTRRTATFLVLKYVN